LPGVLNDIANIAGAGAAMAIADAFGGEKIYVARWSHDDRQGKDVSRLVERVGSDATQKVCSLFGGSQINIPSCKHLIREERNRAIRMDARGQTTRGEMARKHGLGVRQIRRIISDASG